MGVTRDLFGPDGTPRFGDISLGILEDSGLRWLPVGDGTYGELAPDELAEVEALLVFGPQITERTLSGAPYLAIVARFGVGFENVDLDACTRRGIAVTITPDGVRTPMASSALALILALAHGIVRKDRLVREGAWTEGESHIGLGLRGRVLGILGLGNIGRELCRLVQPFGMRIVAHDPYVDRTAVGDLPVELADLGDVIRVADFLVVLAPLNERTRHLLGREQLRTMKPDAYLVNVARGPLVDHDAMVEALREGTIRGAGLDVFEQEPLDPGDPLLQADDLIVTPHAVGWTDEWATLCGQSACSAIIDVLHGRVPRHVVNRDVLSHPAFVRRLADTAVTP